MEQNGFHKELASVEFTTPTTTTYGPTINLANPPFSVPGGVSIHNPATVTFGDSEIVFGTCEWRGHSALLISPSVIDLL